MAEMISAVSITPHTKKNHPPPFSSLNQGRRPVFALKGRDERGTLAAPLMASA